MNRPGIFWSCLASVICVGIVFPATGRSAFASGQKTRDRDYEIAARFAPVFYQALGDGPRSDYITNFDFDGDWRGDNSWERPTANQMVQDRKPRP